MDKKRESQGSGFLCGVLFFLIFLLHPFVFGFAQWENAEISRLTENKFSNSLIRLAMSKNDRLFLLYREYATHVIGGPYKILLMNKEAGQDWSAPELVGDTSCHLGEGCTYVVSMDPRTETIHLIYYEGDKIYYSNSKRDNWEKELVDSGYDYLAEMAFDSLGNVHLAWTSFYTFVGLNYFRIYYATNASGEWVKQVVSPDICTYLSQGERPWIAVEREGVAHIVYPGPVYMNHAWNDTLAGTCWATRFIDPPPAAHNSYWTSSFAVDKNNQLHMTIYTYLHDPPQYREFYYRGIDDTGWAEPEEITNAGLVEHLFVDQQGEVHVVWSRISGDQGYRDMYYAHKDGGQCTSSQIVDHTEYYSELPFAFVIDSEGRGHAAFAGHYYPHGLEPDSTEIYYMVGSPTAVPEAEQRKLAGNFTLFQNYPNPFNTTTLIPFRVNSNQSTVNSPITTNLKIYNIKGQLVRTLVNEEKPPGEYQVIWNGRADSGKDVASGVYFYKLRIGDLTQSRKLVLVK